jgi:hypothetical protein
MLDAALDPARTMGANASEAYDTIKCLSPRDHGAISPSSDVPKVSTSRNVWGAENSLGSSWIQKLSPRIFLTQGVLRGHIIEMLWH